MSSPDAPDEADHHYGRLRQGAQRLRATVRTINITDRTLLVLGGILAPLGLLAIIVGWWGASHSPFLFQQIPYLISGGLFGLALVVLGSFLYFAYWLTQMVNEQRRQTTVLTDALDRIERAGAPWVVEPPRRNGHSPTSAARPLVATARGTMAHRPDCVVVAGKLGVREVQTADGLAACKLCDPYAEVDPRSRPAAAARSRNGGSHPTPVT